MIQHLVLAERLRRVLVIARALVPALFLFFALSAQGQAPVPCTGVDTSGDFSYAVYTTNDTVHFTFYPLAPIAGCTSSIIYVKEGTGQGAYPGYTMADSGTAFIFSRPIKAGTVISFYFTYNVPAGGERNSSANPVSYLVGTVCYAGAPTVAITSPAEAASFTAPATVTINADATDASGINNVSFYNGGTLLGTANTAPYTFKWLHVAAGQYSLTAKAANNKGITTTSIPVDIVVNAPNTDGYCGTSANGDYEYKATTTGGLVTFTFHPLTPIAGCAYALIYIRQGSSGGYGGTGMTAAGTDFVYSTAIANATVVSFYFTYNVPSGGERNSSDAPQSYTVGTNCTGIANAPPAVNIVSPANNASFTEPATIPIEASVVDSFSTVNSVAFYSGSDSLGQVTAAPYNFSWVNVPAGNYTLSAKATSADSLSSISPFVNIVVGINNSVGFCGTLNDSDFSYRAETVKGNVIFTFHPLTPIAGCSYALIYVRQGTTGTYPGYSMTKIGNDFRFVQTISDSTVLNIYFTYNVPSGGERNSSATPQSYTVGSVCASNALPVQLLSYTASLQKSGTVVIAWSTADEINNNYFIIQKSYDGVNYATVAKVRAASTLADVHYYTAQDSFAVAGINYYRLIQVDKDGAAKMYDVKTVNILGDGAAFNVYPNPVTGSIIKVRLAATNFVKKDVRLFTIQGKMIYAGSIATFGGLLTINLPSKPAAGIYVLNVQGLPAIKIMVY